MLMLKDYRVYESVHLWKKWHTQVEQKCTFRRCEPIIYYVLLFCALPKVVARRCFVKKVFLQIWQYLLENTHVGVSFNKVTHLMPTTSLNKKRFLQRSCSSVNFAKFFRTLCFCRTRQVATSAISTFVFSQNMFRNW